MHQQLGISYTENITAQYIANRVLQWGKLAATGQIISINSL